MRHFKYLIYLIKHKYYVFLAGMIMAKYCTSRPTLWRLIVHDWTKFTPNEWYPYVNYFYGKNSHRIPGATGTDSIICPANVKIEFEQSLRSHKIRNDHHWEHWQLDCHLLPQDIPLACVREMIADWMGTGRLLKGKWEAFTWYKEQMLSGNLALHPHVEMYVEGQLVELRKAGYA